MTPVNHLAPKGSHEPLIEYIGGRPLKPQKTTQGRLSARWRHFSTMAVSHAVSSEIDRLKRSGAMDCPEAQLCAIHTLAMVFGWRVWQATEVWVSYINPKAA